jgi:beta-phosphoglucomutase
MSGLLKSSGHWKTIIFDFDGVLVDSEAVKTEAFGKIFSAYPEHLERMMRFHSANPSVSRVAKFRYLVEECLGRRQDPALLDRLLRAFSTEVVDRIASLPALPGSLELLEECRGRIPLYLASVTPVDDLRVILERRGLAQFFEAIYGEPPTPKAQAVREILRREECRPEEAVLIGDSVGDWRVAEETGVAFLGYKAGLPLPDEAETFADWKSLAGRIRPSLEECV